MDGFEDNSALSCDEIFGPILPIVSYLSNDELDTLIDKIENPLSVYL